MRTGRPKTELVVTADERHTLEQWARRPKTAQALARRARIVLACATGKTNRTVATAAAIWWLSVSGHAILPRYGH
jgi:hypothetical protein